MGTPAASCGSLALDEHTGRRGRFQGTLPGPSRAPARTLTLIGKAGRRRGAQLSCLDGCFPPCSSWPAEGAPDARFLLDSTVGRAWERDPNPRGLTVMWRWELKGGGFCFALLLS